MMIDLGSWLRRIDAAPAPDLGPEMWKRAEAGSLGREVAAGTPVASRWLVAAVALGILGTAAVAGRQLLGGHDVPQPTVATADASWLIGNAGISTTSCLEPFSEEALAERSWAFDGMVVSVEPTTEREKLEGGATSVTFAVNRWYTGGQGDTVTVKTYNTPATVSSTGEADSSIGARILASGDEHYLWGCGFSMPFNEQNAAIFAGAFDG